MAYLGLYNADGQPHIQTVSGSSYTGLYSADGCYNGVLDVTPTVLKGSMHPCGALNIQVVTDAYSGAYAADGARNVIADSFGGYTFTPLQRASSSSDAAATTAFLARANAVTTLDGTHTAAYKVLINGGVADGWWTKLDVLMIFATQSSGVALLNMPNATYTATNGGAVFAADVGFYGNGGFNFVTTNFNPSTASGPNYIQDSAHLSTWSLSSATSNTPAIAIANSLASIFVDYTDNKTYFFVNDAAAPAGFTLGVVPSGFYLANRDGATTRQGYRNGVSVGSFGSVASAAVDNNALLAVGDSSAPNTNTEAAISAGGNLNATDQLNFYNRMRTYMTAVGVP